MEDNIVVKQENPYNGPATSGSRGGSCGSSSSSDDDTFLDNLKHEVISKKRNLDDQGDRGLPFKKAKRFFLPPGFLDPLPLRVAPPAMEAAGGVVNPTRRGCKQFWKAGDFEEGVARDSSHSGVGMDHVRVHPKFLHTNATSHKWALGAFAELLDNSLDEVAHGATYVLVDVLKNKKDGSKMLLVEDDGGGMTPDKMRQCMSLGYSAKSKMANTIGQYGNGFKTSTMRLGADVIVFSRCQGKDGNSQTQSIGLLSYTFLTETGKEDIVVPMIDFEKRGQVWEKKSRSSLRDWDMNLEIILQWSPFVTKEDLLSQFNSLRHHGTRVLIYNLWEDDEGELELDFDVDQHDIQIRGANRDEKKIQMARQYPNSRHFLTFQHSLRSYASILYLRLPPSFRIILRGKDVEHHNIVNDMMLSQDFSYKPLNLPMGLSNADMVATGKIGFVKDARHHIDVQGFNVYHKNRLIRPFWRVWNAAGSDGRGVIGVLEANFVEPAHDKQGFEKTNVLTRLESKLQGIQKNYWSSKCHEIGYAARRFAKNSTENVEQSAGCKSNLNQKGCTPEIKQIPSNTASNLNRNGHAVGGKEPLNGFTGSKSSHQMATRSHPKHEALSNKEQDITKSNANANDSTKTKNQESRLGSKDDAKVNLLLKGLDFERDKSRKLESQLEEEKKKAEQLEKDNRFLIDVLEEERTISAKKEEGFKQKLERIIHHGFLFCWLLGGDGGIYGIQVLGCLKLKPVGGGGGGGGDSNGILGIQVLGSPRLKAGGGGGDSNGILGIQVLGSPRLKAGGGGGWNRDGDGGKGGRGGKGKGREGGLGYGKLGKGKDGGKGNGNEVRGGKGGKGKWGNGGRLGRGGHGNVYGGK
ncbi:hypothetical protein Tsubulata_011036 [Turnera subulata]|uniref:Morc S5 domain-containing protein n=1 Tax=Turnera subulata TaxID=218843 RepID=A0A9Q0F5K3_9ROSI|nr:hypothetical protein Tsubulata_011036 [Turnera subulata]